ncbi:MAG: DUF2924 domain-containing protein [Alphaproteobacteria bacterium]|nr:DUF2924 domain-containing protein [Alphaproteobacteria bacterium]
MNNELIAQISALQTMPFRLLKKRWQEICQTELPGLNRKWIVSRLTYKIQELALEKEIGSLEQRLDALAKVRLGNDLKRERKRYIHRPVIGTRLVREYQGIEYQVTVLADGFQFDGRRYRSLSRVAEVITGKSWSGPAFFGLVGAKGGS